MLPDVARGRSAIVECSSLGWFKKDPRMSQKVPETPRSLQKLPEAPKYFADSDRFPIDSDSLLEYDSDPNAYYYDAGSEVFESCCLRACSMEDFQLCC